MIVHAILRIGDSLKEINLVALNQATADEMLSELYFGHYSDNHLRIFKQAGIVVDTSGLLFAEVIPELRGQS